MTRCGARTRPAVALIGGIAAWAVLAAPAAAQYAGAGMLPPGGVPQGALTGIAPPSGKLLQVDLIGRILYDSNFAGGQTFVATTKNLHKDDISYAPSAKVSSYLPIGRETVFVDGSFGYDYHQYNSSLNHARINATAGVAGQFGHCALSITDSFAESQSNQADLPLQVTKNIQTSQSIGGQGSCSTGSGLGAFLSARNSTTNNSTRIGLVDAKGFQLSGGLSYQNTYAGAISLFTSYSTTEYKDSDPTAPPTPGYKSYSVGMSYARPIGTRLKGSVEVSYQSVHPDSLNTTVVGAPPTTPRKTFSSFSSQGSLDYRVTPRLSTNLTFVRAVQPTLQKGSSLAILESVQGNARYALSSRLSATFGASWRRINYRSDGTIVTPLPNVISNDELTAYFTGLSYKVGRRGSLALDARWQTRNTNLTIFDYSDYRVGVTATESF